MCIVYSIKYVGLAMYKVIHGLIAVVSRALRDILGCATIVQERGRLVLCRIFAYALGAQE
jgi:hypothetical protein